MTAPIVGFGKHWPWEWEKEEILIYLDWIKKSDAYHNNPRHKEYVIASGEAELIRR